MIFGIIVEGESDKAAYPPLIQRIRNDVALVLTESCGGVAQLRRSFVGYLKHFQWHPRYQVDKALVIRDSDCRDPVSVEDELKRILDQSGFQPTLPLHFYATRCMVETWMLADEAAINSVSLRRGQNKTAQPVPGTLQEREGAKELLRRMLSQAGLPMDPAVYGEIAAVADLKVITQRCPYFAEFEARVHAC